MKKKINYGSQFIDLNDINSVKTSLTNELITSGNLVKKFEDKISNYTKAKFSITCNNGTSAIYLALKSIDLKKNDIVIMPSINFISSFNVVKILGATLSLRSNIVEQIFRSYPNLHKNEYLLLFSHPFNLTPLLISFLGVLHHLGKSDRNPFDDILLSERLI